MMVAASITFCNVNYTDDNKIEKKKKKFQLQEAVFSGI